MKKFDVFAFVCLLCGTFQLALMTAGFEAPEGRELVFGPSIVCIAVPLILYCFFKDEK